MNKPETVAVIGGDLRYVYLAGALSEDGCRVLAVGFDNTDLPPCVAGCTDAAQAIALSDAVLLPMPVSADGKTVNAPFSRLCIPLEQVYAAVREGQPVCAGGVSEEIRAAFERRHIAVWDYLEREELAVRNAVPTAEGAIQLAMEELPVTIDGASCLIAGYGRIGKVLSRMLCALGAEVTVAARKCADRAWATVHGCRAVHTEDIASLPSMDVVFNTVPTMLFDRRVLASLDRRTLLIDLASRPGGVDFKAAAEQHLKTVWALSLPGRVAPKTAAEIIKSTVMNIWKEAGV
ncbi:MAG: dipicolinate synthase subunit DpsA [Clostridia bacterium]|nr:dipicolinate synthase subunit DpsA [Clostridia bacterium]